MLGTTAYDQQLGDKLEALNKEGDKHFDLASLKTELQKHGITNLDKLDPDHHGLTLDEVKSALKTPVTVDDKNAVPPAASPATPAAAVPVAQAATRSAGV